MESSDTSVPRELIALLGLALVVRLSFALAFDHRPVSDERAYEDLAINLATTGTYAAEAGPTAYRPVGYPAFLAAVFSAFGHSLAGVRVVQALLDASVSLGMYYLARRYGRRAGVLAAGLWAVNVPAVIYTGLLLSESLAACVLVWAVVLLAPPPPLKPHRAISAGILAGFAVLIKPWTALFFGPLFLVPLVRPRPDHSLVLAMLSALLITGIWIARNKQVLDTFAISTNTGLNLYIGNNPEATGAYQSPPAGRFDHPGNEVVVNRIAATEALRYIASHPWAFAKGFLFKAAHVLRTEGELLVIAFHEAPEDRSTGFLHKYSQIPPFLIILVQLPFAIVLISGLYSLLVPPGDELMLWIAWLIAVVFLVHGIFFGGSRFHFPLLPFFTVLSARVLPTAATAWTSLGSGRRFVFTTMTALVIGLWAYEYLLVAAS